MATYKITAPLYPPIAVPHPAYEVSLADLCKCGHNYGDHSNGMKGRCQYGWPKSNCACPHFVDTSIIDGAEEEWDE